MAPPVGSDLSPTGRALRALELLQARPGVSAAELAERLGVTERAARRYVAILREAGIEVESTRGPYGGYRLGRGTRLPPVWFTQTEALSLVMAVLDSGPGDGEVGPALDKVVRALPERVGREAATLRDHAATAPVRHPTRPDPATTTALVAAVAARRRVHLSYRAESGNAWEVEVDPWAVVVRHGRWYLLCHSHRADAIRTYRLDRIGSVEQRPESFEPPAGLDPVAELESNLGTGWEFTVRRAVRGTGGDGGALDPAADGPARGRRRARRPLLRARREHRQSRDVRPGVAGPGARRLHRRGGPGAA